jgi:transglutaminase superfamily protein
MRLLRSFMMLSSGERRLLLGATLLSTVVQLALGRLPFTVLRRLVTRVRRSARRSDHAMAEQVVWAVTAVSRRAPGRATCLSRALTVHAMLARRGYPSSLRIGVVRGARGELQAHAWVESSGRVLIGGTTSDIGHFIPLASFGPGSGTPFPPRAIGSLPTGR